TWTSDSFTYRAVDDDGGLSAPATVTFWISGVNDAPTLTAGPATVTGTQGHVHSAPWASAISPGPGDAGQTDHSEHHGPGRNAAPVAVDDPGVACNPGPFGGSFPIPEDWGQFVFTTTECGPLANDSDADGTITSWEIDTLPAHGDLEWLPTIPGTFGYTPDAN